MQEYFCVNLAIELFRLRLRGLQPTVSTPVDAMRALEATLAAEESARTGQVVKI